MKVQPLPQTSTEDAVATKAVLRAAAALGLSQRDLAHVIGVSEATVSRLASGKHLSAAAKEGELALLLVRVFRSLDALLGGDESKLRAWFHAENDHIRGVPAQRIISVQGLVEVATYLDAMRGRL